jgi:hypothetical protein
LAGCLRRIDPWKRTAFVANKPEIVKLVAGERPFVPLTVRADRLDLAA